MDIAIHHRLLTAKFCFACLIATTFASQMALADDDPPSISVSGTAEIRVTPDEAVLSFSVDSREEGLDDAVKDNDEKIKAVVAFLKESKVEDKHVRTDVISIEPIFEQKKVRWKGQTPQAVFPQSFNSNAPNRPFSAPLSGLKPVPQPVVANDKDKIKKKIKPVGYTARRSLSVTIKDLAAFETIYRGLISKGVNNVGGSRFRTTELRKFRDEARLKAVRAAREKAEAMAAELGASLASVQRISEGSFPSYLPLTQNSLSLAPSSNGAISSVNTGTIKITANVQVVFLLGETELEKK